MEKVRISFDNIVVIQGRGKYRARPGQLTRYFPRGEDYYLTSEIEEFVKRGAERLLSVEIEPTFNMFYKVTITDNGHKADFKAAAEVVAVCFTSGPGLYPLSDISQFERLVKSDQQRRSR